MSTSFVMKGFAGERYHGAYARGKLDIRGHVSMSGPQAVGKGGVPDVVADIFRSMPNVEQITLQAADGAVIYSRLKEVA